MSDNGALWEMCTGAGRGPSSQTGYQLSDNVRHSERNMHHRDIAPGGLEVALLVVEEHVGAQHAQDPVLGHAAEEEHLVGVHAPVMTRSWAGALRAVTMAVRKMRW